MSPPTMIMVPRQPTAAMIRAGDAARSGPEIAPTSEIWAAMLRAHETGQARPRQARPEMPADGAVRSARSD